MLTAVKRWAMINAFNFILKCYVGLCLFLVLFFFENAHSMKGANALKSSLFITAALKHIRSNAQFGRLGGLFTENLEIQLRPTLPFNLELAEARSLFRNCSINYQLEYLDAEKTDPKIFNVAKYGWNHQIEYRPAFIVQARNSVDVQEAVRCAAVSGLKVVARSGGSDSAGFSSWGYNNNSVIVDLAKLNRVLHIDPYKGTVSIQPSAESLSIFDELSQYVSSQERILKP